MSRFGRLAVLGPLGLFALSAACTQMLDIQDAWVDPSLTASQQANGGNGSAAGGQSSGGGGGTTGGSHNHSGGSAEQAGNDSVASAGTSEMAGAAGADTTPPSACEVYCDAVLANCKGKYEQYRSVEQCLEVCKRLPAGTPGDGNVNSVECRTRQANFAESEAFLYCKSAGPLGAGKCGSNCDSYCSLMSATCTQSATAGNQELSYFGDTQACLASCNAIPDDPTGPTQYSSSPNVEPSSLEGNNVYCRTYHVTAGIEGDSASEHCPHAMGGDPCIAP